MTRVNHFRAWTMMVAAAVAASILAMTVLVGTAEAAFPGSNGKIVFSSNRTTGPGVDNPTGDDELFTMNSDGSEQKRRTTNAATDQSSTFSPNGKKIAFTSFRKGDHEVFVMKANGEKQRNLTKNSLINDYAPDWQPLP